MLCLELRSSNCAVRTLFQLGHNGVGTATWNTHAVKLHDVQSLVPHISALGQGNHARVGVFAKVSQCKASGNAGLGEKEPQDRRGNPIKSILADH